MGRGSGIQFRLVLTLVVIGLVAIAGILAILPYRLYERDIRIATSEAHRVSSVVQAALACPLRCEGNATDLVNRIQGVANIRLALSRREAGEMPAGAVAGRGSSVLDDTDLRYVSTPVLDEAGNAWIAELQFDLAPMKRESLRVVYDVVLAVAFGSIAFGVVVFFFVRSAFVLPLRALTRSVDRMAAGEMDAAFPDFESREMTELAEGIGRIAKRS